MILFIASLFDKRPGFQGICELTRTNAQYRDIANRKLADHVNEIWVEIELMMLPSKNAVQSSC